MPYGSFQEFYTDVQVTTNYDQISPGWGDVHTVSSQSLGNWMYNYRNRTGSNVNAQFLKDYRKRNRVTVGYVLKPFSVPNGPRLSFKIYSPKKGRYVWARQNMTVWRRVPVRKSLSTKSLDLKPNSLVFRSVTTTVLGGRSGTYSGYSNMLANGTIIVGVRTITYSGDLWNNFRTYGGQTYGVNMSLYAGETVSTRFTNAEVDMAPKALSRLYEKVKNQNVNLAQMIAERRQTYGMLGEAVQRLAKVILSVRKGNLKTAAKYLFPGDSKQLANDYLIYQYGVKPLLSDIEGICKELTEEKLDYYDVVVQQKKIHPRQEIDSYVANNYCKFTDRVFSSGETTVKYKVRVKVRLPASTLASRLGLMNWASLGYELTPWSFVLDWLWPVGEYINHEDAFAGLEVVYVTKTVFHKELVEVERQFVSGKCSSGYTWPSGGITTQIQKVRVDRSVLPDVPALPVPRIENPFSGGHILNGLALIRQLSK